MLAARIGSFRFHGETTPALRDVNVSVRPGTLTAVLGGSGSGKTTLGKLLAGWHRPGQSGTLTGSLTLDGEPLEFRGREDDPRINPSAWSTRVGFVPQDAAAMLSTVRSTVAEELAFGLENRGTPRPDMLRAVAATAALTGLSALLDRDPATLSGGELRRLAMACAVIQDPAVLVLDEPLASLDAAGIIQVRDLINRLTGAGTAVVVLSQTADGLARSAGHWIILDGGTATASGPPRDLIRSAELARTGTVLPAVTHTVPAVRASAPEPAAAPVLELEGVGFGYPGIRRRRGGAAAEGPRTRGAAGGDRGGHRPQRGRQIHAAAPPQRSAAAAHRRSARPGTEHRRDPDRPHRGLGRPALPASPRPAVRANGAAGGQLRPSAAAWQGLPAPGHARRWRPSGCPGQAQSHPAELPASRQRLLALATVLARGPAVLALDEPTVGLDRHGLERLDRAVAAAAARGAAVVMVTHDAAYARATAHRVLALDGGTLREA